MKVTDLTWRKRYEKSKKFISKSSSEVLREIQIKAPKKAIQSFWAPPRDDHATYFPKGLISTGAYPNRLEFLLWPHYVDESEWKKIFRIGYFHGSSFGPIMANLFDAYNVLMFIGSGVSLPYGVPSISEVINKAANLLPNSTFDFSTAFSKLKDNKQLLSKFMTWFHKKCEPVKKRLLLHKEKIPHYIAVKLWRDGYIDTLVTTNWDMILEESAKLVEWGGEEEVLLGKESHNAAYKYEEIKMVSWTRPSWTIISRSEDLDRKMGKNCIRLFKIHGSPPYYFCPDCKGMNRWKEIPKGVSTPHTCSEHGTLLTQDIVVPNEIDKANPKILSILDRKFAKADAIICIGYSGKDEYLFKRFFKRNSKKLIVIDPNPDQTHFVKLTNALIVKSTAEKFFLEIGDWLFSRDTRERADPEAEREAFDLLWEKSRKESEKIKQMISKLRLEKEEKEKKREQMIKDSINNLFKNKYE